MTRRTFQPAVNRICAVAALALLSAVPAWSGGYKVIHLFGRQANTPSSGLVLDTEGNAYGTTARGGFNNAGTVYRLSPTTGYQIIYAFSGHPDGRDPQGNLVFDAAGNLYGTTVNGGTFTNCSGGFGCGTAFKLTPPPNGDGPWTETVLHSFAGGTSDGANPPAGVILDSAGNVYGTTEFGGYQGNPSCQSEGPGCGTVFELEPSQSGWTETLLHAFTGVIFVDGGLPQGGLIFDAAGSLYGTTGNTAFEMSSSPSGWDLSVIHQFSGNGDGASLVAGMVFDPAGNLYGTTELGGEFGMGTVFELMPNAGSWTESMLHSFAGGSDGREPEADVTLDAAGDLYGTTFAGGGGVQGAGTVFKLTPGENGQWTETVFRFKADQSGLPKAPVLLMNGSLYGTSSATPGDVFRITQ